jgi:CO/xanthine dehydrogenase FAD-binding subunit
MDAKLLDEAEKMASASVKPIADIRSTAEYRAWVSGRLVRDFLESLR